MKDSEKLCRAKMLAVTRKIKYVSLSYILCGLSKISSKAFCQKKLFASPISTPSAVVTVRLVMCQMCTILSCTNSKNFAWKDFTCLATVSLHMHDEIIVPWQGFPFLIYIARQIYTLLKTLFHISYLHGRFFGKWNLHQKCQFPFYWSCKIVN